MAAAALASAALALAQTTYYVNGSCGNDSWTGLSPVCEAPDGPKATIQAGINAADHFDSVEVADGIYRGEGNKNIEFFQKEMSIHSAGGPTECIIDCENDGLGFTFCTLPDDRPVTIEGFTIRNGRSSHAGGICIFDADVEIRNCVVEDCLGEEKGGGGAGGIYMEARLTQQIVRIVGTKVRRNVATTEFGGGIHSYRGTVYMEDCEVTENELRPVYGDHGYGGGMSALGKVQITDCTFARNIIVADDSVGAGLYVLAPSSSIRRCVFDGNIAQSFHFPLEYPGYGGGAYVRGDTLIEECKFVDNVAGYGGGLYLQRSTFVVRDSIVAGNTAWSGAGIMSTSEPLRYGLYDRVTVAGNVARVAGGGAMDQTGMREWRDCRFLNNRAALQGGGLWFDYQTTITNCEFSGNRSDGTAGAIYSKTPALQMSNSTIANNFAAQGGGGLHIGEAPGEPGSVWNSIIWGNWPGSIRDRSNRLSISRSNVAGDTPRPGNLDVNPRFVSPSTGDFRLNEASPCIDAGDNHQSHTEFDLAGEPRRVDDPGMPDSGLGVGPKVDMGCYEFQGTSTGFITVHPRPGFAGRDNLLQAAGATPGHVIYFVYGIATGLTEVPGCPGTNVEIVNPRIAATVRADAEGNASKMAEVPRSASRSLIVLQAVDREACAVSNLVRYRFP